MSERQRVLATVALLTFAVSILQVVMSRVFAGLLYDSLSYVPISMALLGLSGGGIRLFVLAGGLAERGAAEIARRCVASATAATLGFLVVVLVTSAVSGRLLTDGLERIPFDERETFFFRSRIPLLAIYGVASVFPFYFLGMAIAALLRGYAQMVNTVYFFDLMGATAGAALAVPLLDGFVSVNYFVAGAIVLAVAGVLWDRRWRVPLAALCVAAAGVQAFDRPRLDAPTLRVAKHAASDDIAASRWSSAAYLQLWGPARGPWRILQDHQSTVVGGSFSVTGEHCPPDGCAAASWLVLLKALGRLPRSVCILTAGIGLQAQEAWDVGIRDVTAVEMNPALVGFAETHRPGAGVARFLGSDGVDYRVDEARHFMRTTERSYDLIYIPPSGYASLAALPTTPNHLFTEEAIVEYLARLTPRGLLAIHVQQPWRAGGEALRARFVSMLRGGLRRAGHVQPDDHVLVVAPAGYIFVSPTRLGSAERSALGSALAGSPSTVQALSDVAVGLDSDRWRITDDYPFAFGASSWAEAARDLAWWVRLDRPAAAATVSTAPILISLVLVPFVILLPLGRSKGRAFGAGDWLDIGYFFCLGAGFMLIEIPLMEKLIFALGHPTHSISFCLAVLLATTGVGSFASGRLLWGPEGLRRARLNAAMLGVVALQAALYFGLQPLLAATLSLPTPLQYLAIALGIAPLGLLLGVPFPQGIALLREGGRTELIPWAWGVNGAASVLAVNVAVVAIRIVGVSSVLLAAAGLYALAFVLLNASLLPAARRPR